MKKIEISTPKYPNTYALVDDDDYGYLNQWKWRPRICGNILYVYRRSRKNENGTRIHLHRVITNCPDLMVVDHINHDALDNRRLNLRVCTRAQNLLNQRRKTLKNKTTSKYKGVTFRGDSNMWRVGISYNYKRTWVGQYDNEIDAAKAYDKKAKELHGDYACLNFPSTQRVSK